eukprot:gene20157-26891_t
MATRLATPACPCYACCHTYARADTKLSRVDSDFLRLIKFQLDTEPMMMPRAFVLLCGVVLAAFLCSHASAADYSQRGNTDYPCNDIVSGADKVAGRIVSLACQGPVVVRAVLKLIDQGSRSRGGPAYFEEDCAEARLGEPTQSVTRCELLVPEGNDEDEIERVTRAKEVNCKACHPCYESEWCLCNSGGVSMQSGSRGS